MIMQLFMPILVPIIMLIIIIPRHFGSKEVVLQADRG